MDLVILIASFGIILLGAELFTNGIEWFGHKMGLGEGAVGSVLAAVGTALPETTIPIVAILFSSAPESSDVGLGAILGAPFMLATLAIGVTGLVVLLNRGRRPRGEEVEVDRSLVRTDLRAFTVAYAVLILLYARYVKSHFDAEGTSKAEDLNPLRIHPLDIRFFDADRDEPRLRTVNLQVLIAVALTVVGAVAFVGSMSTIARSFGMNEILLALIVAPIATELPEGFNAVLWIRQGKDTLALANITGAMVFQASIATVVALVFAPEAWSVQPGTRVAFASAAIAFISIGVVFLPLLRGGSLRARNMLLGIGLYVAYLAIVAIAELSG